MSYILFYIVLGSFSIYVFALSLLWHFCIVLVLLPHYSFRSRCFRLISKTNKKYFIFNFQVLLKFSFEFFTFFILFFCIIFWFLHCLLYACLLLFSFSFLTKMTIPTLSCIYHHHHGIVLRRFPSNF